MTVWSSYFNTIKSLTLNDVTSIPSGSLFVYMTALTELDLPNAIHIENNVFNTSTNLTTLKLTAEGDITIDPWFMYPVKVPNVNLTLNANKRTEVNGNQWKGFTWKEIKFE